MKKRLLHFILAIALVTTLFGAVTITGFARGTINHNRIDTTEYMTYLVTDDGRVLAFGVRVALMPYRGEVYDAYDIGVSNAVSVVAYNGSESYGGVTVLTADGRTYSWTYEESASYPHNTREELQGPSVGELGKIIQIGRDAEYNVYMKVEDGSIYKNAVLTSDPMPVRNTDRPGASFNDKVVEYYKGSHYTDVALCYDGSVWTNGSYEYIYSPRIEHDEYGNEFVFEEYYLVGGKDGWVERTDLAQKPMFTPTRTLSANIYTSPHTMHLENGVIYGAGHGSDGQLGWGFFGSAYTPAVANIVDVKKVSAGDRFTLALKEDGTVWGTGFNEYGKLGNGNMDPQKIFVQTQELTNVKDIAAGKRHSLALKNDGTVWAWGSSSNGQLGQGNSSPQESPVQVPGLSNIEKIAAGNDVSMALTVDGEVYVWGGNYHGQMGDGGTIDKKSATLLNLGSEIEDIAAGDGYCLALTNTGSVLSWGRNFYGSLGQDNWTDQSGIRPDYVMKGAYDTLSDIVAISAGADHAAAVDIYGNLWAWGRGNAGQLGSGGTAMQASARRAKGFDGVNNLANVTEVSCGKWYTMAALNDGTVIGFGSNERGQLGIGIMGGENRLLPVMTEF